MPGLRMYKGHYLPPEISKLVKLCRKFMIVLLLIEEDGMICTELSLQGYSHI